MIRILAVAAALVSAPAIYADQATSPGKGQFYIAPGAVGYAGPESSQIGYEDLEVGPGLIIGYGLSDNWSVEVLGAQVEADFDNVWGRGEDDIDMAWLNLVYKFGGNNGWQPFVTFGGGRTEYGFDDVRPDAKDNQLNAGFGLYRQLNDFLSLRADVRGVSTSKEGGLQPFAFVGLTGFIGSAGAPSGRADSDGDGVRNRDDKCPTTPAGRVVDATGCELDADGDGVVDGDDRCPGTPAGVPVDANGCERDTDGDGVPDHRDDCPDTEAGAKVNDRGCYIELEEEVTIDMNIEFETDKAQIRPDHRAELSRAVNFLRQYPNTNAMIEGHTDSDGSTAYNQALSERRARAVYEYIISEGGIAASRLDWIGYGETRPIASNDTAAGKQTNRRVTAVVSGTHKVRQ